MLTVIALVPGPLVARRPDCVQKATGLYLRDVQDHLLGYLRTLEIVRDSMNATETVYFTQANVQVAQLSTKTNRIMALLTLAITILLPLNMIASLMAMNVQVVQRRRHGGPIAVVRGAHR